MSDWREMDPFEKLRRWVKVSPEMAELLVRQAAEHANVQQQLRGEEARHKMRLDEENSKHLRSMELRHWWTQFVSIVGGFACIGALIAVTWQFASSGNILPGIAIATLGGGLIAGVFGTSRSLDKKTASIAEQLRLVTALQQAEQQGAQQPEPTPSPTVP